MRASSLLLAFLTLLFSNEKAFSIRQDNIDLIKTWAPFIWLHHEDPFFPSNVDFYLNSMEVRDENETLIQTGLTPENLIIGPGTSSFHLNTFEDIDCVHCYEPHFYGQEIEEAKHNDPCDTVDVTFTAFYPYNYGKDVCLGLDPDGFCLSPFKPTFGNHISDWEHIAMRFQNGKPTDLFLSVHSFGARYKFDEDLNVFTFFEGEDLEIGKILSQQVLEEAGSNSDLVLKVDYPETVFLVNGTHPEVFSANGSHGIWAVEGSHRWLSLIVHMDDECSRGSLWNLADQLVVVDSDQPDEDLVGPLNWMRFQGRWGNIKKVGCELEAIFTECGLNGGVGGPDKNFEMFHFENPPLCQN